MHARTVHVLALATLSLLPAACASINGPRGGRIFLPPENHAAEEQFARLKALEGTWAWAPELAPDLTGVVVTYEVTAAGSAVLETMFPGDRFEMVTLYHLDGSQLVLTHYSSAGNQPTMRARQGDADGPIHFEYLGATNLSSVNTGHMHRMSFLEIDGDELLTSWTFHEGQRSTGDRVFKLARLAPAEELPPVADPLADLLPGLPEEEPAEEDLDASLEALEAELAADLEEELLDEPLPEEPPVEDGPLVDEPVVEPAIESAPIGEEAPVEEPDVVDTPLEEQPVPDEPVVEEPEVEEEPEVVDPPAEAPPAEGTPDEGS